MSRRTLLESYLHTRCRLHRQTNYLLCIITLASMVIAGLLATVTWWLATCLWD